MDGTFIESFEFTFYIAFGMSVVYALLIPYALKCASILFFYTILENDTLGVDEDGNKAKFPHK